MIRHVLLAAAACGLISGCSLTSSTHLLADLTGSGDRKTPAVNPSAAWQIEYSWDCSSQISQGRKDASQFGYSVFNADDNSAAAENNYQFSKKGKSGSGTIKYQLPGIYYLQIQTPCTWHVKMRQGS